MKIVWMNSEESEQKFKPRAFNESDAWKVFKESILKH